MAYPEVAWERAMTVQEVMLKAISGELHWYQAAEILGWSPRTLRRWRERYEAYGYGGLFDKRRLRPSGRRLPPGQLAALLQLLGGELLLSPQSVEIIKFGDPGSGR